MTRLLTVMRSDWPLTNVFGLNDSSVARKGYETRTTNRVKATAEAEKCEDAAIFIYNGQTCCAWRLRCPPPPPLQIGRRSRSRVHETEGPTDQRPAHVGGASAAVAMGFTPPLPEYCGNGEVDVSFPTSPRRAPICTAGHQSVAPRARQPAVPPVGHLLPRGTNGIDGVMQKVRESQNLYYTLQARRLKREKHMRQQQLTRELDNQRAYKRMWQLSELQEELVQVYGPSVKHIISDTFFDDGTDPVLSIVANCTHAVGEKYSSESGPKDTASAWHRAHHSHCAHTYEAESATVPQKGFPLTGAQPCENSSHDTREVGFQRAVLLRALSNRREGRRQPY